MHLFQGFCVWTTIYLRALVSFKWVSEALLIQMLAFLTPWNQCSLIDGVSVELYAARNLCICHSAPFC